jgi:hypothetical protein
MKPPTYAAFEKELRFSVIPDSLTGAAASLLPLTEDSLSSLEVTTSPTRSSERGGETDLITGEIDLTSLKSNAGRRFRTFSPEIISKVAE